MRLWLVPCPGPRWGSLRCSRRAPSRLGTPLPDSFHSLLRY